MEFRDQLRGMRERSYLTQAQVASILGVSPPRISEWERGIRTPKPLTQEAIVAKLKKAKKGKKKAKKKVAKKAAKKAVKKGKKKAKKKAKRK